VTKVSHCIIHTRRLESQIPSFGPINWASWPRLIFQSRRPRWWSPIALALWRSLSSPNPSCTAPPGSPTALAVLRPDANNELVPPRPSPFRSLRSRACRSSTPLPRRRFPLSTHRPKSSPRRFLWLPYQSAPECRRLLRKRHCRPRLSRILPSPYPPQGLAPLPQLAAPLQPVRFQCSLVRPARRWPPRVPASSVCSVFSHSSCKARTRDRFHYVWLAMEKIPSTTGSPLVGYARRHWMNFLETWLSRAGDCQVGAMA
jgi:hypothetical protein